MTYVTPTRLADGRELMYFDSSAKAAALHRSPDLTDSRNLMQHSGSGTVRLDPLTGEWIAVAAHRQGRTHLPSADQCPLCPSTPDRASEIPAADYEVAVFENRFASFGPDQGALPDTASTGNAFIAAPAYGRCEVVVFDSVHEGSFGSIGFTRARTVVDAWAQRTAALSALPGVQQVFCFENRGKDIGVTLEHPHGQIYAYPFLPPRSAVLAARAGKYYDEVAGRQTLAGAVLEAERNSGERMVLEGKHFSAYVPFAARWPLEVHLVPHRQVPDFAALSGLEKDELTELYLRLLNGFDALYDSPTPYIAAWHQAPIDPGSRKASRLHLQLTSPRRAADKLKFLAGSEAAMGAFINDTMPERVAQQLRGSVAHV